MILDLLFTMPYMIVHGFLSFLPSFPATPEVVSNIGQFVINLAVGGFRVMVYFFGLAFTLTMMGLAIAFLLFDQMYHMSLFVIKKIPLINVK